MQLTETQRRVAEHRSGDLRVAAVAGAGKTTAALHLIEGLIRDGQDPSRILATTFSRRAAAEVQLRLDKLVPNSGVKVGTLHAVCLAIIRDGSPWASYEVAGDGWSEMVIRGVVGWHGMRWDDADVDDVLTYIASRKSALEPPVVPAMWGDAEGRQMNEAYYRYEAVRVKQRKLTFDDMPYLAATYLRDNPQAAEEWASRYDWVLVDEFQDTSVSQYEVARVLASKGQIVCFGDDDQSIFAWRGADPSLIIDFCERHEADSMTMEENYRCGRRIAEVANRLIAHNEGYRIDKAIAPQRDVEGEVHLREYENEDEEAAGVATAIEGLIESGVPHDQIAVLYRTVVQSQAIEDELYDRKIPYVVVSGGSFYKRREVATLLHYLKAHQDDKDDLAWSKILNSPFRYLSRKTMDRIYSKAQSSGWEAAVFGVAMTLGPRQAGSLRGLLGTVAQMRHAATTEEKLQVAISTTGYREWLKGLSGGGTEEGGDRTEAVDRLLRIAQRHPTPDGLFQHIRRFELARAKASKNIEGKVQLMTCHASKGTEYQHVFLIGLSCRLMPHEKATDLLEERRLAYVAVTRAKDGLYLSYSGTPSPFIEEMGL